MLSLLGRATNGSDTKLRSRLRSQLSLKQQVPDEEMERYEEPVPDSLIPAAA
jgi:hypothetical protein